MIRTKTVIGVIIAAILIGISFVALEKNFRPANSMSSEASSAQELSKQPTQPIQTMNLPSPDPSLPPVDSSSDLLKEASNLQMRDYSQYFEDLKAKAAK